jgi:hypothetical protein
MILGDKSTGSNSGSVVSAGQVALNNARKQLDNLNTHIDRLDSCLKDSSTDKNNWVLNWVQDQKDFLKRGI